MANWCGMLRTRSRAITPRPMFTHPPRDLASFSHVHAHFMPRDSCCWPHCRLLPSSWIPYPALAQPPSPPSACPVATRSGCCGGWSCCGCCGRRRRARRRSRASAASSKLTRCAGTCRCWWVCVLCSCWCICVCFLRACRLGNVNGTPAALQCTHGQSGFGWLWGASSQLP